MFKRFLNWVFSRAYTDIRKDCQFSNLRGYKLDETGPVFLGYCTDITEDVVKLVNDDEQIAIALHLRNDDRTRGYVTKRWNSFRRKAKPGVELAVLQVTTKKGKVFYTFKEIKIHDYLDV